MSETENSGSTEVEAVDAVVVEKAEPRIYGATEGICKCGHPENTHGAAWRSLGGDDEETDPEALGIIGEHECVVIVSGSSVGWLCGCEGYQEICKVSTPFPFRRGEYGDGRRHTLVKGLLTLAASGGIFVWENEKGPTCEGLKMEDGRRCVLEVDGEPSLAVPPYPVRTDGKWGEGVGETVILCLGCYRARNAE